MGDRSQDSQTYSKLKLYAELSPMSCLRKVVILFLLISMQIFLLRAAHAQESLLNDLNGDGVVSVMAFGDSITYGVGDGVAPGLDVEEAPQTDGRAGYPKRIEQSYGISVENRGVPGEEIAKGGVERIVAAVRSSNADLVVFLEGVNDSIYRLDRGEYSRLLQKVVNVCRSLGKKIVLTTLQTPCCIHAGRDPFVASYTEAVKELAGINDLAVVDLDRAWRSTCRNKEECELYNLPEGLHPNTLGYDVMGQTVLAELLGINIFASGGAAQLEQAIGAPAGTVVVKPDEVLP
jgi:lysophospholipase L1-like esterase